MLSVANSSEVPVRMPIVMLICVRLIHSCLSSVGNLGSVRRR